MFAVPYFLDVKILKYGDMFNRTFANKVPYFRRFEDILVSHIMAVSDLFRFHGLGKVCPV